MYLFPLNVNLCQALTCGLKQLSKHIKSYFFTTSMHELTLLQWDTGEHWEPLIYPVAKSLLYKSL